MVQRLPSFPGRLNEDRKIFFYFFLPQKLIEKLWAEGAVRSVVVAGKLGTDYVHAGRIRPDDLKAACRLVRNLRKFV